MMPGSTPPAGPLGDVSVLIVNWNSGPLLARCAKAALATTAEVLVVDNASTDGSADAVAARLPAVRLFRQHTNLGFAGGVNLAARAARGRWLLLLNPDTVPSAAAIARLRETLLATPGAGAVGACLVGEDGRPQGGFSVRRFPTLATWAADLLLIDNAWPGNPARRRYLAADLPLTGSAPVDVDQPAGACLMVSRQALERVGGLDERFHPAWFEDVDLCRRLRAEGLRVLYEPRALVPHIGGVSVTALGRKGFERAWYGNLRRYARKHHGTAANVTLTGLVAVGMLLRLAVSLATRDRQGRQAWCAVLKDLVGPVEGTTIFPRDAG
jgi:GT2 family glycosyltransferase